MKKIIVNKNDEAAVIVEKIIEADDSEVVLSVPRFAHIGATLSNFYLLKREADVVKKKVLVESTDDRIIELSEKAGLVIVNSSFIKNKRQISDIVAPEQIKIKKRLAGKSGKKEEEMGVEEKFAALEARLGRPPDFERPKKKRISLPKFSFPKLNFKSIIPSRSFLKKSLIFISVTAVLGGIIYAAVSVLPRAEVRINARKQEWTYNDSVLADKSAVIDIQKMSIPAQVFFQKKNNQLKFPATGKRPVEKYASGAIVIYNSYSSDQQQLIERTRFSAPDGKIFRLKKSITVPGAKIIDGKIVPSSIAAEVIADAPGPNYNIGPVKLFTIPGFKNSPKYQSFYGESIGNMNGGFIGEVAYPTESDIKKAKDSARVSLEDNLKFFLLAQIPKEFKIADGAISYDLISQKVDSESGGDSQFGIFSEAQMAVVAFKEKDVKDLLIKKAIAVSGNEFEIRNYNLEYGLARIDFEAGKVTFPVKFTGLLARKVDIQDLRIKFIGKSKTELQSMAVNLPGTTTISMWPIWVNRVPNSSDKIKVIVE